MHTYNQATIKMSKKGPFLPSKGEPGNIQLLSRGHFWTERYGKSLLKFAVKEHGQLCNGFELTGRSENCFLEFQLPFY